MNKCYHEAVGELTSNIWTSAGGQLKAYAEQANSSGKDPKEKK